LRPILDMAGSIAHAETAEPLVRGGVM